MAPAKHNDLDSGQLPKKYSRAPFSPTVDGIDYFRILAEESPNMIFINKNGAIVYANNKCEELMGYTLEEFTSPTFNFLSLIAPSSQALIKENFRKHSLGKNIPSYEYSLVTKSGESIEAIITTKLITYQGSNAILGIVTDITSRKHAEVLLKQQEEQYRIIVENSSDMISRHTADGTVLYVTPSCEKITGYTAEELIGQPAELLLYAEDAPRVWKILQMAEKKSDHYKVEHRLPRKDGTIIWIENRGKYFRDSSGTLSEIQCDIREITERKQIEEALQQSEQTYREIFNATSEAIFIHDVGTGKAVDVNDRALSMFGYQSKKDLFEAGSKGLLSEGKTYTHQQSATMVKSVIQGIPKTFDWLAKKKDGKLFWVEISLRKAKLGGTDRVLAVVRDIDERKCTEAALIQSEQSYREIFNATGDSISIYDAETAEILDFNESSLRIFGYNSKTEMLEAIRSAQSSAETQNTYIQARDLIQKTHAHEPHTFEWPMYRKDKEQFWAEVSLRRANIGGKDRVLAVTRDINERKRAEAALSQSERNYREIFNATNEGIIIRDLTTGHILDFNDAFYRMHGYSSKHEALLDNIERLRDGAPSFTFEEAQRRSRLAIEDKPQTFEWFSRRKTGDPLWTEVSVRHTTIGDKPCLLAVLRDITDRKKTEDDLRRSETLFRTTLDSMIEGCQIIGSNWYYLYINDAAEKQNKRPKEELIGHKFTDVWPGIEQTRVFRESKRCMDERVPAQIISNEFTFPDGEIGWFDLYIQPIPEGIFIFSIDRTQRQLAEIASKKNEELYRSIFENTGTATIIIEADTTISLVNKEFESLSGYTKEEIEGKMKWTEFVDEDDLEFMLTQHHLRRQNRDAAVHQYEFRFIDRFRKTHDIFVTIDVITGTARSIASLSDISLTKNAASEIRKSEERFRSLVQQSADIITVHDADMTIRYATPSITKALGYAPESLIGKSPLDLTHPDDTMIIANEIQLTLNNQNPGTPTEFRIRHADGRWIHLEAVSNNQLQNPDINGIIVTSRDITEKKQTQTELQQLNERLRALAANLQHVREEESTRIAREIHDELGQLLTGIKMDLSFLEELHTDRKSAQMHNEIMERIKTTSDLTDRAIHSMRKITSELRPAILDTMGLSAAIEWQVEEFQKRTGIRCSYFPRTIPSNIGKPCATAVFRILQESLSNISRHSHASNVTMTLDQNGAELIFEIEDDGVGIKPRDTTKETSFGILGMQERAWLLGGSFSISGRKPGGTTVHVQIPIHEPKSPG